jgi:hypothetical protein
MPHFRHGLINTPLQRGGPVLTSARTVLTVYPSLSLVRLVGGKESPRERDETGDAETALSADFRRVFGEGAACRALKSNKALRDPAVGAMFDAEE